MKKDIGPSYFSARWRGMVRPLYSEVYTFSIAVDDGAKLWINDLLVIDHWYSRCSEVDGTIALMAGTLYPMRLEYKQVVGNASAHLSWSSRSQGKIIVPSTSLYSNSTTYNLCNRNESLYVEPAVVCSATSTAEGAGLTGATAGMPAKFTIQSRDEYMNNRKLSDAGIRPGSAEYFCDDWAHSGTLLSGGAHTLNTVLLDATSASAQDDYYTGRTITLTSDRSLPMPIGSTFAARCFGFPLWVSGSACAPRTVVLPLNLGGVYYGGASCPLPAGPDTSSVTIELPPILPFDQLSFFQLSEVWVQVQQALPNQTMLTCAFFHAWLEGSEDQQPASFLDGLPFGMFGW